MDPDKLKAAIEALKNADGDAALKILEDMLTGAATPPAASEPGAEALAESADPKKPDETTLSAAVAGVLMQLTGASTAAGAVEVFRGLKTRIDSIDSDRAVIELSERRGLIADLVKLSVEVPATAWEGDPKDRTPSKRLAAEPIGDLRDRVGVLKAAKGIGLPKHTVPEGRSVTLSAEDQATADKITDPTKKARFIELRTKYSKE